METCPNCGYKEIPCEVPGCKEEAEWEGWYRVVDFTGNPTGLIQKRMVCELHKFYLIGYGKEETDELKTGS